MKKILLILLATLVTLTSFGTDYTIEPKADGADPVKSRAIPLRYDASSVWGSVSQQIYLASELTAQEAGAGDITAITFYYTASSTIYSDPEDRDIQVFLMQIPAEQNAFNIKEANGKSDFLYVSSTNKTAGTRVFNGTLTTEAVTSSQTKTVKITFDDSFPWDGTSNLVLTVFDLSVTSNTVSAGGFANIRFLISKTSTPRFLSKKWYSTDTDDRAAWIADISNNLTGREGEYWTSTAATDVATQTANRSYVNKVDFSITPAAVVIPAPTNLSASSITTSSATLTWNAAAGATGYNVRWGKISGSLDHGQSNVSGTSLPISDLEDGETYYFDVQTITSGGTSAYASEANFETTAITHEHDGITFSKWSSTTSMPTSGNYYLKDDVSMDPYDPISITLTGNLNLCLNGNTANIWGSKIVVPNGKTLTIYDNVGDGKITGVVASEVGVFEDMVTSLIVVKSGGTLVLKQGIIENNYVPDADGSSYAIYSNGTVRISGDVLINSNNTDIYLHESRIITLDAAISNAEKHIVYQTGGAITSGWNTYMSGADPRDYFESSNSARSVCLNEGEAALRLLLNLSENNQNSAIGTSYNQLADVNLTRSTLYSAYFNTICLPFALDNVQLEEYFGAGYDLEEFVSSSLDGDLLNLTFNQVTALEAGKPYLLQPSMDVTNPSFIGVTIGATSPLDITTTDVDFKGIFRPTVLDGGNENLLFLYPDNELRWPEATDYLKGFRAYFEIKGQSLSAARRARIVLPSGTPTAVEAVVESQDSNRKWLKDGQIIIERNGRYYNITGQRIH